MRRRRALHLRAIAVALVVATAGAHGWSPVPDVAVPRQEVALAALGDDVYVIGGFGAARETLASVERWRPGHDAWETVTPLPLAVNHPAAVALDGRLYVLGGFAGPGLAGATDAVQVYDPAADAWSFAAPLPSARGGLAAAVLDGRIVAVGGARDGVSLADAAAYDPATDAWTLLPPLPTARDHLGVAVLDGRLHAVGGRDGTRDFTLRAHEVYDAASGAWSTAAPLPTGRSGHAVVALDGCLYALGGEGNRWARDGMFDQVERYVAARGRWQALPAMPVARHGAGALAVGDQLVVVAGATVAGYAAATHVDAYLPPPCQ